MRLLRQILEIAIVSRSMWEAPIAVNMLPKLVNLIVLSLVAGLLGCLVVVGLLYLVYRGAGAYGLDQDSALLVTGLVVLSAFFGVLVCISRMLCKLKPRTVAGSTMSRLHDVADAFIDGLTTPTASKMSSKEWP